MKVLLLGANGQLGKEIQKIADERFTCLTRTDLDITDKVQLINFLTQNNFNIILNCTAYNQVDQAEQEKNLAYLTNAKAVHHLAELCRKSNTLLIHFSTDYVFNGSASKPYLETDVCQPLNYYGYSKHAGEELIRIENGNHIIIRTSWLYSAYNKNFVKTICQHAKAGKDLEVVADQIGTPTRAADLAAFTMHLVNQENANVQETYHFSNLGVASWYDFAHAIVSIKGYGVAVNPTASLELSATQLASKAARPHYSIMSKQKVLNKANFSIPHWYTALQEFLADQPDW